MTKHLCRPTILATLVCLVLPLATSAGTAVTEPTAWTQAGWGGGGYFYSAAFHPAKDGVLYVGGDVNGVYKSEDHGRTWRIINNGIANYGVFSLATDPTHPDTVYAATEGGLCKSVDAGEHWKLLPETGPQALRITGEKGRSIRAIAIDPTDGNIVYAASPAGKVFKSINGGQTWAAAYEKKSEAESVESIRIQFGKVNGQYFGGIWSPLVFPTDVKSGNCSGFGFSFKGDGSEPREAFITLKLANGAAYRSHSVREIFKNKDWYDVVLHAGDFSVDPEYKTKNAAAAAALPESPDWAAVARVDLSVVGLLPTTASVARLGHFFFALTQSADGKVATIDSPVIASARDFSKNKSLATYGNARAGDAAGNTIYSVAISAKDPSLILAATADSGLVLSDDAGKNWRELPTPKQASSAAISPTDSNLIYASFFGDGVWKSTDRGQTWADLSAGLDKNASIQEVAISPTNPLDVYAIGRIGWAGLFYFSKDGGQTWTKNVSLLPDYEGDPTLPNESAGKPIVPLSVPTNITINPQNPREMFLSANWRSVISDDGGQTLAEHARGMDISCVTDLRFHNGNVYASAMDEGVLMSADNGQNWKQLWPLRHSDPLSGHYWRLAVDTIDGSDRIISTSSPWATVPNQVVISPDGGKTFSTATAGLPNYIPTVNAMWGRGFARALAVDPHNPKTVYLGIDGDPSDGKSGGGIFKSDDSGQNWKQLPNQPRSRRMFFGLAVDPTDSKRLFWGATGNGGGLYRSDDGGLNWKLVFTKDQWIFNVMVTKDGVIYCPGTDLWRSDDHGDTWKQISNFTHAGAIVGLEVHPNDPKTIWVSTVVWSGSAVGGIYKTTDGGTNWTDITGDIPSRRPFVLRFNPVTNELWAAWVGIYRLKQ